MPRLSEQLFALRWDQRKHSFFHCQQKEYIYVSNLLFHVHTPPQNADFKSFLNEFSISVLDAHFLRKATTGRFFPGASPEFGPARAVELFFLPFLPLNVIACFQLPWAWPKSHCGPWKTSSGPGWAGLQPSLAVEGNWGRDNFGTAGLCLVPGLFMACLYELIKHRARGCCCLTTAKLTGMLFSPEKHIWTLWQENEQKSLMEWDSAHGWTVSSVDTREAFGL